MSRPKPCILVEYTDKKTYRSEQVIEAKGIWVVLYNNNPISLKSFNSIINYPGPKYKKTSFSNPGHAFALAKRLNTLFKTADFTVKKII